MPYLGGLLGTVAGYVSIRGTKILDMGGTAVRATVKAKTPNRPVTLFVVAVLLSAGSAWADPTGTLQKLSSQPASLLDLGMHRLEIRMDDLARHPGMHIRFGSEFEQPIMTTTFDAKKRRILIRANYDFSKPRPTDDGSLKAQIEEKIKFLKFSLGVDPDTGTPLVTASALLPAFSHQDGLGNIGMRDELDPMSKQLASDLDETTEVSVRVGLRMFCHSDLASSAIECKSK